MIVKVQRSLIDSAGRDRTIVYDESGKCNWEGETPQIVIDKLNGRSKAFFLATVSSDGRQLILGEEAPWQTW